MATSVGFAGQPTGNGGRADLNTSATESPTGVNVGFRKGLSQNRATSSWLVSRTDGLCISGETPEMHSPLDYGLLVAGSAALPVGSASPR